MKRFRFIIQKKERKILDQHALAFNLFITYVRRGIMRERAVLQSTMLMYIHDPWLKKVINYEFREVEVVLAHWNTFFSSSSSSLNIHILIRLFGMLESSGAVMIYVKSFCVGFDEDVFLAPLSFFRIFDGSQGTVHKLCYADEKGRGFRGSISCYKNGIPYAVTFEWQCERMSGSENFPF